MRAQTHLPISLFVLLLGCGTGCSKGTPPADGPAANPPGYQTNGLWKLAPADTYVGVVAAPGAGDTLAAAWTALASDLSRWPESKSALAELHAMLPAEVFDPDARSQAGIDLARGAALFVTEQEEVLAVLPIADRAAARARMGATTEVVDGVTVDVLGGNMRCRELDARYLCASNTSLFASLGTSEVVATRIAKRPTELRGEIEMFARFELLPVPAGLGGYFDDVGMFDAALQFSRGAFTIRAHLQARPVHPLVRAFTEVPNSLAQRAAESQPTGLWSVRVPISKLAPAGIAGMLEPMVSAVGVDAQTDIIDNLTGELAAHSITETGADTSLVIALGVQDGRRLQPLIPMLCSMAMSTIPAWEVAMDGERCTAAIAPESLGSGAGVTLQGPIKLALGAEPNALRLRVALPFERLGTSAGMTPMARELATGDWNWSVYGSGNVTAVDRQPGKPALMVPGIPWSKPVMWLAAGFESMGLGLAIRDDGVHALVHLGTQWANPEPVLRAYREIIHRYLNGETKALDELATLAEKHPDTAFGRSYRADPSGLILPSFAVGLVAAVAIPSFMRYVNSSKSTEARVFVKRLHDNVHAYYHDPPQSGSQPVSKHLPRESIGPTPPIGTCCAQGGQCAPDPAWWAHPTWQALGFVIMDPHYYSYQYQVADDGQSFTVRAIGDLDCDGNYATFEMDGQIVDGALQGSTVIREIDESE